MPQKNVLIVGVGGQGTLLASKILGNVAISQDYDVKVSEVHGMSQRGGSVVTYVKYSDTAVHSPIIDQGEADIIIAFELLEAYRSIGFLKRDGRLIVNSRRIDPMPVITGMSEYPCGILEKLSELGVNVSAIDAFACAVEAGSGKAVNTVLIGLLASGSDIRREFWEKALVDTIPEKLLKTNQRAFDIGFSIGNANEANF